MKPPAIHRLANMQSAKDSIKIGWTSALKMRRLKRTDTIIDVAPMNLGLNENNYIHQSTVIYIYIYIYCVCVCVCVCGLYYTCHYYTLK